MTDDAMTDEERSELASAFLDSEVAADERDRVLADPALMALVDELAAVRARLSATPRVDPVQRDQNVAAGLSVFTAGSGVPASLTVARARRSRPLWVRLAPAGAVAVVLAAVIGLAVTLRPDEGSDDTTAAGEATAAGDAAQTTAQAQALSASGTGGAEADEGAADTTSEVAAAAAADASQEAQASTTAPTESTAVAREGEAPDTAAPPPPVEEAEPGEGGADTSAAPETTTDMSTAETLSGTRAVEAEHPCDDRLHEERTDLDLGTLVSVQPPSPDGTQRLGYSRADGSGSIAVVIDPETCQVVTPTP